MSDFQISRRHVIGAMAGLPLVAGAGTACSVLSGGDDSDQTLRINYGGSADATPIPDPNPIAEALSEVVGFTVVSERSPEDMGTALAGGQAPDIFLSSRSQLRQFDAQGLLLDLSQYRDRLADYEAFVGTEHVNTGLINDRLIGVVRKPREYSYSSLWIRGDWLDELGLDMPTTLEEYAEVLQAFREEKPGRDDAVAMTGYGLGAFDLLFGAFELGQPNSLYASEGQVVDGFNDPNMPEALEYVRSLIADGLVDPDLFSLGSAEARDRALQGGAGVIHTSWDQMTKPEFVAAGEAAQPDAEWRMLDVLNAPGKEGGMPTSIAGAVQGVPAAVAEDEERLETLLHYINYVGSDEGYRLTTFGIEGTHYEMDGDTLVPLPAMDEEGSYFFAYKVAGDDPDISLPVRYPDQSQFWQACRDRKRITQYEGLVVPPEDFSVSDVDRFADEQLVLFLTGERDLDEYPQFLDELNGQFNYEEYVDSAREQLDKLGLPD